MQNPVLASALLLVAASVAAPLPLRAQQAPPADPADKYLYLEDVSSPAALAWVKQEDDRTAKVLEADPRFAPFVAEALKVAEDPNRLALPDQRGEEIYNFWRYAEHIHGIYRKTTLADYLKPEPNWHTVIDYDALAAQDKTSWVSKGLNCLYPDDHLCPGDAVGGRRRR